MNRSIIKRALSWGIATLLLTCCAAVAMAQTSTTVERGEVLNVSGNDILIKMDTGEVRHFTAPPGATGIVDGKTLTVADLKPGMKLQRTITTTKGTRTVSNVRTVQGVVKQVNAPYVTFQRSDGEMKRVKVPDKTQFTIEGQKKTVFELRPGMRFTATVVTEGQEVVVSSSRSVTGANAPAPKPVIAAVPPKIEETVLIEEPAPAPAPKPAETAAAAPAPAPEPAALPKTGSPMPFIGMLGFGLSLAGLGMRKLRNR
jgi:LPXTG-motif cell wall-anchored protein